MKYPKRRLKNKETGEINVQKKKFGVNTILRDIIIVLRRQQNVMKCSFKSRSHNHFAKITVISRHITYKKKKQTGLDFLNPGDKYGFETKQQKQIVKRLFSFKTLPNFLIFATPSRTQLWEGNLSLSPPLIYHSPPRPPPPISRILEILDLVVKGTNHFKTTILKTYLNEYNISR